MHSPNPPGTFEFLARRGVKTSPHKTVRLPEFVETRGSDGRGSLRGPMASRNLVFSNQLRFVVRWCRIVETRFFFETIPGGWDCFGYFFFCEQFFYSQGCSENIWRTGDCRIRCAICECCNFFGKTGWYWIVLEQVREMMMMMMMMIFDKTPAKWEDIKKCMLDLFDLDL